jgi:hypothetical protein
LKRLRTAAATRREENQLLVFERKRNLPYRWRNNFELEREFDSPSTINIIKTSRLSFADKKTRRLAYFSLGSKTFYKFLNTTLM